MKENLIGVVILLSFIGALVLLCVVAAIDEHYRRRRRQHSMGSNTYDLALATRSDPWPELFESLPTSGQQTGDASDGWSETDADAPTSTQGGSLVRPPPVVMRDNSRSSLGYEQSFSSASWSTPPPVYAR
jgi:hypothetical protein